MQTFTFNIQWTHFLSIDADTEDEAWAEAYARIDDEFGKSRGTINVELEADEEDQTDEWAFFDTDPEDNESEELYGLVLDDEKY